MPVKVKDLAADQSHLIFSEVGSVEAMYSEPSEAHDSLVKFFAPKAFIARNEYESRKEKQKNNRLWLANINLQRTNLQLNQLRLQEMVKKNRSNSGAVGL